MCSVEAGSKARPEMYVLGARQVMEAVGMDLACLTRLCEKAISGACAGQQ